MVVSEPATPSWRGTLSGSRRPTRTFIADLGVKKASQVGLKVNLDRVPTAEEVRPAVTERGIIHIRLTDG